MVCEVSDPNGVVLALTGKPVLQDDAIKFPWCHMHIQQYVVPEQLFSVVAENGLGAKLLSGCAVLSALRIDILVLCAVINMLDFIVLGSMGIGREGTQQGFWESCN